MLKKFLTLLFLMFLLTACEDVPPLEGGTSNVFAVGDEWAYQTRPGEALSSFIVTKIDKRIVDGEEQTIIHIAITELAIEHPGDLPALSSECRLSRPGRDGCLSHGAGGAPVGAAWCF